MLDRKYLIFPIFLFLVLLPFSFFDSSDDIKPPILSDSTIGYYQSTTCEISLAEFYIKNFNQDLNIYFNNNDYADLKCFGKITGVDKLDNLYMVSIGTNTSINLILQSTIWLIFLIFIPRINSVDRGNHLSLKGIFFIPLLFIIQLLSENRFYSKTNIMHNSDFLLNNYYLIGSIIFLSLLSFLIYDLLKNRYLNLTNYLPYLFLIIGTYSGMNLNIYLIIFSFFGAQSVINERSINKIDILYFFMSFFWVYKIKPNEYFFDGDKLRGFTNSSYSLLSQIYWILVIYLFVKGLLFIVKESKNFLDNKIFMKNSLISGSLIVAFGFMGSISPLFNFFNFYIFGQNKRGMKEFTSIAGNTWRGFSASAESIGEFYGLALLIFFYFLIKNKMEIDKNYLILLIPVLYGLYRSNNFAAISSLFFISTFLFLINTNIYKRKKVFFIAGFIIMSIVGGLFYLSFTNYNFLSTELIYEATLHHDFYTDSNLDRSYVQIENKMIERDLKTMLYDERNYSKASSSYIFLVERLVGKFNIPLIPNIVAIVSTISLIINRTEMWGIFIAKYNPNFIETIFGTGPFQLNKYLYGHEIRLDVPDYKLQSLFLPHSSILDLLLFSGVVGVFLICGFIIYTFFKNKELSLFKILTFYLCINFLKSDSILYINSLILIFFVISHFYYIEKYSNNE
tara:strand:- start:1031 stop:3067 length:2037 start_codon:yes stop_codon:yes gene_type:complete